MNKRSLLFFLIGLILIIACEKALDPEYHIDPNSCNACGDCVQICQDDAIEFGENGKAVIDQTKCTQCGKCITICPQAAIY